MSGRRVTVSGLILPVAMIGLGLAMIVRTVVEGGFGIGILLGVLFVAAGAGRLYVERRTR